MSPAFEAYLARIYTDADERALFLADPRGRAESAGLAPGERDALARIDRDGLDLAVRSLERKREASKRGARSRWPFVLPHLRTLLRRR